MKRLFSILPLIFGLFSPFAFAKDRNTILVGSVLPMTGGNAAYGASAKRGLEMAKDEINANGGVLGKDVEIDIEDSASKSDIAAVAAQNLIGKGVVAVIGEVSSGASLAMGPLLDKANIPMISHSATNEKVTQWPYVFRVCFVDPFQGLVMAKFVREKLGLTIATVFYDYSNDYSVGLGAKFTEAFRSLGGQVEEIGRIPGIIRGTSYDTSYPESNFRSQLTAIKYHTPKIQFVFVPGNYGEVGLILRQAKTELKIPAVFGGGDGWGSPLLPGLAGKAIEDTYYSDHFSPNTQAEGVTRDFIDNFQKKYGFLPDAQAALAYDAAQLLFDAIERANSVEGPVLRDALAKTENFDGVTGKITIDEHRNARKAATIIRFDSRGKGQFVDLIGGE